MPERLSLSRYLQSAFVVVAMAVAGAGFQNCGGYNSNLGDGGSASPSSLGPCSGGGCPSGPESVLLFIGNADPERLLRADRAFDVGGYCDPAGYPGHRIVWTLKGPTGVPPTVAANGCDALGRFQLRVDLPGNYDHGSLHTLEVQLIAVDGAGREVVNPLGRHRRELGVITLQ